MKPPRTAQRRHLPTSPFGPPPPPPPVEVFDVGDSVTHDKYGLGRVVEIFPDTVIADFGDRLIRISAPYAKMTKL